MAMDQTKAMALKLAKDHCEKMGWQYDAAKIGEVAAEIIKVMEASLMGDTNRSGDGGEQ